MAFGSALENQIRRMNKINRNVDEQTWSPFHPGSFWGKVSQQNFAITGGDQYQRNSILMAAVQAHVRAGRGPLIILNGNDDFEREFESLSAQERLGRTIVCSANSKGYDLFCGMPSETICSLIQSAGVRAGIPNLGDLIDYADGIVHIAESGYPPTYLAIEKLAQETDADIAEYGIEHGVGKYYTNTILAGAGRGAFHRALKEFNAAFQSIRSQKDTGFSISRIRDSTRVFLIRAKSELSSLMHEVFARELSYLRNTKGVSFTLMLNDINLLQGDPLQIPIADAAAAGTLGTCHSNLLTCSTEPALQEILLNAPILLVLNSGAADAASFASLLKRFGEYDRRQVTAGAYQTPGIVHAPWDRGRNMGASPAAPCPRVQPDDMRRFAIAVRGDRGDTVSLYQRIQLT